MTRAPNARHAHSFGPFLDLLPTAENWHDPRSPGPLRQRTARAREGACAVGDGRAERREQGKAHVHGADREDRLSRYSRVEGTRAVVRSQRGEVAKRRALAHRTMGQENKL